MISELQKARQAYKPKLPLILAENSTNVIALAGEATESVDNQKEIAIEFKKTYGLPILTFKQGTPLQSKFNAAVILSGGQAPGGHNVIAGIFDFIKELNPENKLYGFCGGPSGLTENKYIEISADFMDEYRNTGGFDIIGSGRTKLEENEQFDLTIKNCKALGITNLVVIGGDDSNTNACILAEYFLQQNSGINVIGCPKTIDGDLKNDMIETSFGFDTACKVYSELIGNIQRDANSAKKYWHFIKLMGRSASHIALECGLQTQANVTIVSEEVEAKQQTIKDIVNYLAKIIKKRADNQENFGVILIPEGLVEFIPEMKKLINELNDLLAEQSSYFEQITSENEKLMFINSKLAMETSKTYSSLPISIQKQLIMDRDPHGNVQVSRIETEKLLITLVEELLMEWKVKGTYKGKFSAQAHFFGYEGRCAAPSNFDADYCYSLGYTAGALMASGKTGYMTSVRNLTAPASDWVAGGVPITMMMNMERRHGSMKPVIKKALVELDGKPFLTLKSERGTWEIKTSYIYPGPIQYFGPTQVCDSPTKTLVLEK